MKKTGKITIRGIDGGNICAACGQCCSGCFYNIGFFDFFEETEAQIKHYFPNLSKVAKEAIDKMQKIPSSPWKSYPESLVEETMKILKQEWGDSVEWDNGTAYMRGNGFLGKNGCTIPRQFRSEVCVNFACDKLKQKH